MPTNKTLIFKKVPSGFPIAGQDLVIEDRGFDPSAAPPPGGLTLSILYASFDPYQRGRMRPAGSKSYSPPYDLDGPIPNSTVAKVLKSDAEGYQPGDLVIAFLPIAEYATLKKEELGAVQRKVTNPHGLKDLGLFLGPLGMPGLTGWSSLHEIGKPKKGETIFISSAAGAVGQVVGQIAKREGLKVIGSVGDDQKLEFITKELGFDGGFNYKKEKALDALERLAPEGIDIYYENVGGEQLEAALEKMNQHGRIVACGMVSSDERKGGMKADREQISQYNLKPEDRYGVRNLFHVVSKRITMQGFIVGDADFGPKYAKEHQEKMAQWLADGSVQAKIHVTEGIDNAAEGLIGMLHGKNFGKAVIKIKDE
jgi:NADPH-dependent curcumin reductase CurA